MVISCRWFTNLILYAYSLVFVRGHFLSQLSHVSVLFNDIPIEKCCCDENTRNIMCLCPPINYDIICIVFCTIL